MTQKELAIKSGISWMTVWAVEHGEGTTLYTLERIAEGLGTTVKDLIVEVDANAKIS